MLLGAAIASTILTRSTAPPTAAAATPAQRNNTGSVAIDPIVFVSRQIPLDGSIYLTSAHDMPGVGARSRFRVAAPGRLLVRESDGRIRVLVDGQHPSSAALNPALTIAANALRVAPKIADATRRD